MLSLLLWALAASGSSGGNPCIRAEACRRVETVRVQTPDGKDVSLPIHETLPWVVEDNLLLLPGDWVIVRLVEHDGRLSPHLVTAGTAGEAPQPASDEVRVKVHAFENGNLLVEVLNGTPAMLDYGAVVVVGTNAPQRTSVCSLKPGVVSLENWRWPIRQIALFNFRVTKEFGCKTADDPGAATPPARSS